MPNDKYSQEEKLKGMKKKNILTVLKNIINVTKKNCHKIGIRWDGVQEGKKKIKLNNNILHRDDKGFGFIIVSDDKIEVILKNRQRVNYGSNEGFGFIVNIVSEAVFEGDLVH